MLAGNASCCFIVTWLYLVVRAPVVVLDTAATATTTNKNHQDAAAFLLKPAPFQVGTIEHLQWDNNNSGGGNDLDATNTPIAPYSARIRMPWTVTDSIRMYCEWSGIYDLFRELFVQEQELNPGTNRTVQLDGVDWYLQRPIEESDEKGSPQPKSNNRHWLAASDEASRAHLISILARSGFDEVLDRLGSFFQLDGIDMYSVGIVAATYSDGTGTMMTTDFSGTGGKAFHMLIPLQIKKGSRPEVFVEANNTPPASAAAAAETAKINYEYGVALVLGDDTKHAPGMFDYRDSPGTMSIALSIYLSDTNEENVAAVIKCGGHDKKPLPPAASEYLLQHRGRHWKKDGSVRLAQEYKQQECSVTQDGIQICEGDAWDYLDWSKWGFFDFQHFLQCDGFYASERPVPDPGVWKKLREMYVSLVGDKSTLLLPLSSDEDGFMVKVKAELSPGKGRGIFADQFIPKGTLVYSSRQHARFPDGYSYKKFLMSVPVETACDLLAWMSVQDLVVDGVEKPAEIVIELDQGSLVNGGIQADHPHFEEFYHQEEGMEVANLGCIPKAAESLWGGCKLNDFALRDIQVGEELLIDYQEYSIVESDKWQSLGLGMPGGYSEHDE